MGMHLQLGDIRVDVVLKDIKNVHLSVHPPAGGVRISAPRHMKLDTIRVFAISRLDWIRQQQQKLREQARETQRDYLNRESHYVWGTRYLLSVVERDAPPAVELEASKMLLQIRPGTTRERRQAIVEQWHRDLVRQAAQPLIAKWEPVMGVKVQRLFVQRMKTMWGSCNSTAGNIRLNSDLARKPPVCLEYILVHEMTHLLEPTHNDRFRAYMDRFMPKWQHHRDELNHSPLSHQDWHY